MTKTLRNKYSILRFMFSIGIIHTAIGLSQTAKIDPQIEQKIDNRIITEETKKRNSSPETRKVSGELLNIISNIESVPSYTESIKSIGTLSGVSINEKLEVQVIVTLFGNMSGDTSIVRREITSFGGNVRLLTKASIESPVELYCWIPYAKVKDLAKLPQVGSVRLLHKPTHKVGAKLTEGDQQLSADKVRDYFNVSGNGIKIGVISTGVPHRQNAINSNDLPPSPQLNILYAGNPSNDEGTAMLEIVHDIAPNATLYFAGITETEGANDMAARIELLKAYGCRIIVDDLGFPKDAPQYSADLLYNTVMGFRENGTNIYITAAGNDGNHCWDGLIKTDVNGDHLWWYANNQWYDKNYITLEPGERIELVLQWADKWNYSRSDYDIYLFSAFGDMLAASNDMQGFNGSLPVEITEYTNSTSSPLSCYIKVRKSDEFNPPTEPDKEIRLIVNTSKYSALGYKYPNYTDPNVTRQIYGKEMAASITVGAYPSTNPSTIEASSSRGPSNFYSFAENGIQTGKIVVNTPAIVATDGVQTKTGADGFFSNPFYGTSAAAPHIAGIAALYFSKYPTGNFYSALTSSGLSIAGGTGGVYNNIAGYGKANAEECLIYSLSVITPGTVSSNTNWVDVKVNGVTTIAADVTVTIPPGSTSAIEGTIIFSNTNSKIVVSQGGALIIRKSAIVDPSHVSGNVFFENMLFVHQLKEDLTHFPSSTFERWDGYGFQSYPAPKNFTSWHWDGIETFKASQTIIENQKYNHWTNNGIKSSTIVNPQTFAVEAGRIYAARFKTTYNSVTLKSSLLEAPLVTGSVIDYKDPWLIDINQGQNQGVAAPFKSRTSPFYPNKDLTYGSDVYQGVFLNQDIGQNTPYYSLRAPLSQSLFIPLTNKTHKLYLQSWSAQGALLGSTTVGDIEIYGPNYRWENPINFTSGNAIASANYKATQFSNTQTAFRNNSQRKVVAVNGYLYSIYESLESVWLEKSTDGGVTWDIENSGKPLNTRPAKSPSLSTSKGKLVITYQEKNVDPNYTDVKVNFIYYDNNTYFKKVLLNSFMVSNSNNIDLNPVTAFYYDIITEPGNNSALQSSSIAYLPIVTSWEEGGNISIRYGQILSLNNNTPIVQWGSNLQSVNNAMRPSATARAGSVSLVWERMNSSTSSDIYYMKGVVESDGSVVTGFNIKYLNNISGTSGYTRNYNPSIISIDTSARICWIGYRENNVEENTILSKNEQTSIAPGEEYRVIFRDPIYNHYWNFGSQVGSPTITRNDPGTAYIIAWSENSGQYNKFANNSLSTVRTLNISGSDVQVANAYSTTGMYAISFKSSPSPYYFSTSNSIGSFPKEQKVSVATGREGVVGKNDAMTYFAFGDISIDDDPIQFVDIDDTLSIDSLAELNSCLVTNSFNLKPNSKLFYSVSYGMRDTVTVRNSFQDNDFVSFRIELVEKLTGIVLGECDNVKYNKEHYDSYNSIEWQVNTEDLQKETEAYFRLVVESNFDPAVSIAEKYSDGSSVTNSFSKNNRRIVSLKRDASIATYSLNQNYPNPFNPTTSISYALPKAGRVVLKVYDILGKEVMTLVNTFQESGRYSVQFDGTKLASGLYIYKITSGSFSEVKKMMLVK